MNHPRTFLFYGPSGAGKGTQAKLLLDKLSSANPDQKTLYIETGARFREFMAGPSFTSERVRQVLAEGGLLPEFLPIWLWTSFLIENYTGKENLILDGLARRPDEAPVLHHALEFYGGGVMGDVVVLNVSEDWVKKRLEERKRYDDNGEEVKKRLAWYRESVMPTIDYFRKHPEQFRVHDINGEQSIEEVRAEILSKLGL